MGEAVRVGVAVAVWLGLRVEVGESVEVTVRVGVKEGAGVRVWVRVGVCDKAAAASCACRVPAARVARALRLVVGEGNGVLVTVGEALGEGVRVGVA